MWQWHELISLQSQRCTPHTQLLWRCKQINVKMLGISVMLQECEQSEWVCNVQWSKWASKVRCIHPNWCFFYRYVCTWIAVESIFVQVSMQVHLAMCQRHTADTTECNENKKNDKENYFWTVFMHIMHIFIFRPRERMNCNNHAANEKKTIDLTNCIVGIVWWSTFIFL